MDDQDEVKRSIMEQHIGTILQIMVVGLLGWSLVTTVDLRTDIGILKSRMENVQSALVAATTDKYHRTDAQRDFKDLWERIHRLEDHVDQCKTRLSKKE